jgi:hypothetical protein
LSHGLQTAAVLHLKNAARIGGTELLTYGERMGVLDVVKQRRFFFCRQKSTGKPNGKKQHGKGRS